MSDSDLLASVKYEGVAAILRQCDKSCNSINSLSLQANTARFQNRKRTPEQLVKLKAKSQCKTCGNWGHWHSDHNKDGSLKSGVKSSKERPEKPEGQPSDAGTSKKSATFHMAKVFPESSALGSCDFTGPLLDDGAPYSGIGISELKFLFPFLRNKWNGKFNPLPDSISDCTHWQYGTGTHSSDSRRMLGSVMLSASMADGALVNINHIVIEGSSQ